MASSNCPPLQFYATKQLAKLQLAVTRIVQGLDPSSALKAMKESVSDDMTKNAAKFAKASAEGVGSEFTQNLIKGIFDQVIDEVISALPPGENRSIARKIKGVAEINFSMIQLVLKLSDSSPLVMASRAKRVFIELINEREALIEETYQKCLQLRQIVAEVDDATSVDSTLGARIEKSFRDAKVKLERADEHLLSVQVGISKKIIESKDLGDARSLITEALQILSPLDKKFDKETVTTNEEIIELLHAGFSGTEIVTRILKAGASNSFRFDAESVAELEEEGMGLYLKSVFKSLESIPKKKDPIQVLWKKAKDKMAEINFNVQKLEAYETRIPNVLNNYLSIKEALEKPKVEEIHSQAMYGRIVVKCRSMLGSIIGRMNSAESFINSGKRPTFNDHATESIGSWVAELAVVLTLLDVVQQGMYEEKKINANPLNTQFFKSYELSYDSFVDTGNNWMDSPTRANNLSSQGVIDYFLLIAGGAHAAIATKDPGDAKRRLESIDSDIARLQLLRVVNRALITDARTHLDKFSPEPDTPKSFDKLFEMVGKLGFDRVQDMLLDGGLLGVLDMPPELGTYIGAAAACLREKASVASNEYERAKFEKAALKLSKKNRAQFLGKVNVSMRSVQAVKNLRARMEEITSLVKSLFEQDFRTSDNTLTGGTFSSLPNL